MYSLKAVSIVQVILLLVLLTIAIFYFVMISVAIGLGGIRQLSIVEPSRRIASAYQYVSAFIVILLVLKLFLLKNNYVLPVGGLIVFIVFVALFCFFHLTKGKSGLIIYDYIYITTLLLLLANSVVYLCMAIKD